MTETTRSGEVDREGSLENVANREPASAAARVGGEGSGEGRGEYGGEDRAMAAGGWREAAVEIAARVAAGTVARNFLRQVLGVDVISHVISIGASDPYVGPPPRISDLEAIDASPVRAFDADAEKSMIAEIEAAKALTLEKNGLLTRSDDPLDGRQVFVRLSTEATSALRAYFASNQIRR